MQTHPQKYNVENLGMCSEKNPTHTVVNSHSENKGEIK